MKFYIVILLLLVTGLPAVAGDGFVIEIVRPPSETLRIQRVVTTLTATGLRVHGRITASRAQYLPEGHVDIANYGADGVLIARATAAVHPKSLSRQAKRKGGVRFAGDLPTVPPVGSTIKVVYHRTGMSQDENVNNHL